MLAVFILFDSLYDMALLSYLIAFGHFSSEILIFGSCKMGPVISPVIVSSEFLVCDALTHLILFL